MGTNLPVPALGVPPVPAGAGGAVTDLLHSLPPAAILKVVDIVGEVVRTRGALAREDRLLQAQLEALQATHATIERRLELLRTILLTGGLSEEARLRIVDVICTLAVR